MKFYRCYSKLGRCAACKWRASVRRVYKQKWAGCDDHRVKKQEKVDDEV